MLYITDEKPEGYVHLSSSRQWVRWLAQNTPNTVDRDVRMRLNSNLKHLLVGMEMKTALIEGHQQARAEHSVLFEPYFQNFISEFCVAASSVLEGLGSAHWLAQNGQDGADVPMIYRNQWQPVLVEVYDETGQHGLNDCIGRTLAVRDKLHQDRLGARENIDWHDFSYEDAFMPARRAIATLLRREAEFVPESSNLPL